MSKEDIIKQTDDTFSHFDRGVRGLQYINNDMETIQTQGTVEFSELRDLAKNINAEIDATISSMTKVKDSLSADFANIIDAKGSGLANENLSANPKRGLDPAGDMAMDAAKMLDTFKDKFESTLLGSIKGDTLSRGHIRLFAGIVEDLRDLYEYYQELLPSVKDKGQ